MPLSSDTGKMCGPFAATFPFIFRPWSVHATRFLHLVCLSLRGAFRSCSVSLVSPEKNGRAPRHGPALTPEIALRRRLTLAPPLPPERGGRQGWHEVQPVR
jgi:hypothetical protein